VCGLGNAVLLKGTVNCIAGKQGLGAEWLISLLAERALEARTVDPLFRKMWRQLGAFFFWFLAA